MSDQPPAYTPGGDATEKQMPPQYTKPQTMNHYGQGLQTHSQPITIPIASLNNTVINSATAKYDDYPLRVACNFCQTENVTETNRETGLGTWVACAGLCFLGLGLGCCCIPCCVDSCKDTVHSCPNCKRTLGKKEMIRF